MSIKFVAGGLCALTVGGGLAACGATRDQTNKKIGLIAVGALVGLAGIGAIAATALESWRLDRVWYRVGKQSWRSIGVTSDRVDLKCIPYNTTNLWITSKRVTDAQLAKLGRHLGLLENVSIFRAPRITGEFLQHMPKLKKLTIGEGVVIPMFEVTKLPNLQSLRLQDLAIWNGDLSPLAKMNQLTAVELIACDNLTGECMLHLPRSIEHVTLVLRGVSSMRVSYGHLPNLKSIVFNDAVYRMIGGKLVSFG